MCVIVRLFGDIQSLLTLTLSFYDNLVFIYIVSLRYP